MEHKKLVEIIADIFGAIFSRERRANVAKECAIELANTSSNELIKAFANKLQHSLIIGRIFRMRQVKNPLAPIWIYENTGNYVTETTIRMSSPLVDWDTFPPALRIEGFMCNFWVPTMLFYSLFCGLIAPLLFDNLQTLVGLINATRLMSASLIGQAVLMAIFFPLCFLVFIPFGRLLIAYFAAKKISRDPIYKLATNGCKATFNMRKDIS